MGAPNYITDDKGNIVYPRTLAKCVKRGGTTLDDYLDKVEDNLLIKPTAQGTNIQLKDSSDMNIQELHLYGKTEQKTTKGIQLLNLKDAKGGTGDGVTYTPNGDGSFKKTGTATGQVGNIWLKGGYYSDWENKTPIITLEVGKSYYIKDCAIFQGQTIILSSGSGDIVNVTEEKYPEGIKITGIRNTGFTLNKTYNEVIYPLIAESSTAVEWEEYTGGQPSPSPDYPQGIESVENPSVIVTGKNLAITQNVRDSNNLVTAKIVRGQKYTLSFDCNKRVAMNVNSKSQAGKTLININPLKIGRNSCSFIAIDDGDIFFNCYGSTDNTNYLQINNIQIERGDTSSDYEPYKEIQTATLNYELNGIGDVKDELIIRSDGTGQLVQKIKSYDCSQISRNLQQPPDKEYYYLPAIDKGTTNASRVLSTHFTSKTFDEKWGNVFKVNGSFYFGIKEAPDNISDKNAMKQWLIGNKVKILFQLEEPIITELSSEEVQKILALHTNKPNTTIWNDQEAEMQVTYVADTKNCIDNKFKELNDAIVASINKE
nr:MAG TPA: hypothetical protein [Bacteriophage sp.]